MHSHDLASARGAGGLLARWRAARRARQQTRALAALSDRLLRDIGLEREFARLPDPMLGPFI